MTLQALHNITPWISDGIILFQLLAIWYSIRSNRALRFSYEVFEYSLAYETNKVLESLVKNIHESTLTNTNTAIAYEMQFLHMKKLPSINRMVFSFKPIKLESYFTTLEIIELTGTIPQE